MLALRRSLLLPVICILAVSAFGTSFAASHGSSRHASKMDSLVVKITNTGTVWGKVTVDYKSHGKLKMVGACKVAKCTFHVPHMAKLHLTETPKSNATWPFKEWKVSTGGHTQAEMGKKLVFEIMGTKATVKAIYVLK